MLVWLQADLPIVTIFQRLQARSEALMHRLSADEAANLIWAFSKARLYRPKLFDLFVECHLGGGAAALSAGSAGKLLWAQQVQGLHYEALTEAALAALAAGLREGAVPPGVAALAAHSVASTALVHKQPVPPPHFLVCYSPLLGCLAALLN